MRGGGSGSGSMCYTRTISEDRKLKYFLQNSAIDEGEEDDEEKREMQKEKNGIRTLDHQRKMGK